MHSIPRTIIEKFAEVFTGKIQGLSGQEITSYFQQYDISVRSYDHYGFKPPRSDLFIESLYVLPTNEQYFALTDLCNNPPQSSMKRYSVPSQAEMDNLKAILHNHLSIKPVGLNISKLSSRAIRETWLVANSRIPHSPSSAITAARSLLETACSTILTERGEIPDSSGNLSSLYKQCRQTLGINAAQSDGQALHQMLNGMTQVVNGIASLSNMAGDRHGLPQGIRLDDPILAMTSVNAAGTIALFLVHVHLFLST